MSLPSHSSTAVVTLRQLFPVASFVGCVDVRVSSATDRADECRSGCLFAVIRGHRVDGHAFVSDAIRRGAAALLVDHPLPDVPLPQCVVRNVRRAYGELCSALHGFPSRRLAVAGVTGTNGKTTITWMIRSIVQAGGCRCGVLGTIEYSDGLRTESSRLTTPDPRSLATWLASMIAAGTTHAAMELSSHALDQHRAAGTLIDAAVITNITQDHFDYHHTFDAYRASKLRIMDYLKPAGLAVINVDDPGSASCLGDAIKRTLTYGIEQPADVSATILDESLQGTRFTLRLRTESIELRTPLVGRHNVSNALAAAAVANHFGIGLPDVAHGIASLHAVPGRMERVSVGQPFEVFVDYAHTDDALRRALTALRKLTPGRLLVVFGAGGDRDRTKRPKLGQVSALADVAIVTSDNPRSEDPELIIQDILAGCRSHTVPPHVDPDRQRAIRWALEQATAGDCVLIAGKGHETEQIVGATRHHFDDREVVRAEAAALFGRTATAAESCDAVPALERARA
jgi:UDP-N-acetylmuramoyl-L-alanyl-D-glutamate--2,6-diaminopimelate ligase